MLPKKSTNTKSSTDLRQKIKVKQSNSHRIKNETPRPSIHWSDVKTGFRNFKIKRWNSIGSWVVTMSLCEFN